MNNKIAAYSQALQPPQTNLHVNDSFMGESIERRIEKIMNNHEPITDGAPQIYTDRQQGVIPEYNIRTDRFEQAIDMTDTITKRKIENRQKTMEARTKAQQKDDEPKQQPTPQTQQQPQQQPPGGTK